MTNKQYKMLRYISKHENLADVVKKYKMDYKKLQDVLPKKSLKFSDLGGQKEIVRVAPDALSEVESRHNSNVHFWLGIIITNVVTVIVSILTA